MTWTFGALRLEKTNDEIDGVVGEEARHEDGVIYFMLSLSAQSLIGKAGNNRNVIVEELVKINKKCLPI